MPDKVDAVIAGAGAAGCLYAAHLAEAGKSVRVLEAGPPWSTGDLVSSQIYARRLKWGGATVAVGGTHPYAHNLNFGSGFGGAALHHYATWPRFTPDTFELASAHGRGRDFPFDYAALRPYYDRVQREIGIAGNAAREPWRGAGDPYPMPPLPLIGQGLVLEKAFADAGIPVAPLPVAINTIEYAGRPACLYDGWCDAGCPIGALANPLVTTLPRAKAAGAVFTPHADVARITTDARGRATGVEYYVNGVVQRQAADLVILAASVIQNPRILLNSSSGRFPQGLGNSTGQVGAHVNVECMAFVYGLMQEHTHPHLGTSAGQILYLEGFRDARRPKVFGGYHWQAAPSMKPNDLFGIAATRPDLYGTALRTFLEDGTRHIASSVGFGGGAGGTATRVVVHAGKDANGVPLARLDHSFDDEMKALWQFLIDEGVGVMKAARARHVWTGPLATGHISGGTLAGSDPARSVVDSYGRVHDVQNVVVAGAGLFPQTGGSNPTFTLYAVSTRSAEHMLAHWGDYVA